MRNRIFLAAAMVASASVSVAAQAPAAAPVPQIVTTGSGEATVSPDRATVMVGVQSRATTAAAAAADNARRQKAVIDTLKALGIAAEQLSTLNYSVSPEMQYNQTNGTSRVIGYVVSNTVRADVRRLDDVGRVVDAALAKGANQINSLQFYSSKADSVRRAALAAAVANSKADAEALARAAGGSLGQLIEITTGYMPPRPLTMEATGMVAMAKDRVQTPIEPGEQTVTAMVTTRWTFVARP